MDTNTKTNSPIKAEDTLVIQRQSLPLIVPKWLVDMKLPPTHLWIYFVVVGHSYYGGSDPLTIQAIAAEAGLSDRMTRTHIRSLESLGLIHCTREHNRSTVCSALFPQQVTKTPEINFRASTSVLGAPSPLEVPPLSPLDLPLPSPYNPPPPATDLNGERPSPLLNDTPYGVSMPSPLPTAQKRVLGRDGYDPLAVTLPPGVPESLWMEWCKHRAEIGHRLTPVAVSRQLALLAKDPDPAKVLTNSLEGGYQGLFPSGSRPRPVLGIWEMAQAAMAEADFDSGGMAWAN